MRNIIIVFNVIILGSMLVFAFGAQGATLVENPLGDVNDLETLYGNVINSVLGILGGLILLAFVIGGFMFIFAAGNEERAKKGKQTLFWATLGLLAILMSYAILQYVFTFAS